MKARAFLAALLAAFACGAVAQPGGYPDRPIRLVVPYAAGGAADTLARIVGQSMSVDLGQPIVVENRTGADGNIGAESVARSTPDGYTVLLGDVGNLTMGPAVRKSTPYDAIRDFSPIVRLGSAPNLLVVHPSVPAKSFEEFIAYAKANPNKLSYASSGTGGSAHLAGELLKGATGIEMVHVPYKGASAAIVDVLRGDVQVMFGWSVVLAPVRDGKLRALASTGATRSKSLPDLPTIAELGFPGFEAVGWYGLLAPAGTPRSAVVRLNESAAKALQQREVREKLEAAGYHLIGGSPEEFAAYIKSESTKWSGVVAKAGIKVE